MVITAVWLRSVCWSTRKYEPRCASASTTTSREAPRVIVTRSSAGLARASLLPDRWGVSGERRLAPPGFPSEPQGAHLIAEALDARQLDALVAADHVREIGQLHRLLVVLGREPDHGILDQRTVFPDQRALDPAHLRAAEGNESRAPEALHAGEEPEGAVEPGPELDLRLPSEGPEDRRMQVILDLHAIGILRG